MSGARHLLCFEEFGLFCRDGRHGRQWPCVTGEFPLRRVITFPSIIAFTKSGERKIAKLEGKEYKILSSEDVLAVLEYLANVNNQHLRIYGCKTITLRRKCSANPAHGVPLDVKP